MQRAAAEILAAMQAVGAIITDDHLVYASGRHGREYFDKDGGFPYPAISDAAGQLMAAHIMETGTAVATILGPMTGGAFLARDTARHLWKRMLTDVRSAYTDKDGDLMVIKRPACIEAVANQPIWVTEDVLTTGGSALKAIQAAEAHGAKVQGLIALCNRGGVTVADIFGPDSSALVLSLIELQMESWPAEECPLCAKGIPINTQLGHGAKYVAEHGQPQPRG